MSINFLQECIRLTIAMKQKLKNPAEKIKLEKAHSEIVSIINKNFPEMVDDYYNDIK